MRFSRCSRLPLWMQRRLELERRSELRVIPRRSASRAEPRKPKKLPPPRTTPFKWARRTWETRRSKERSKGERDAPSRACATRRCLRAGVPPRCSSEPLLSPAMRASWDGGPIACFYTFASSAEVFVPIVLPRRSTPFQRPRCFSPWESNDGRDRSLNHPTGPSRYATVIPALQRRASAPLFPKILARG